MSEYTIFNDREVGGDNQEDFLSSSHDEQSNVLARKSISAEMKLNIEACSPRCSCNTQCSCVSKSRW